jgi:hypothetical protein
MPLVKNVIRPQPGRAAVLLAALAALLLTPAWAAEAIGTVKRVSGTVRIERAGARLTAEVGMPVFVADRLFTGREGSAGITLRDETLLAIGPDSVFRFDAFAFDPSTERGAQQSTLRRGRLAVVSGRLAKTSPEKVEFHTPASVLGVRGTEFIVEVRSGALAEDGDE